MKTNSLNARKKAVAITGAAGAIGSAIAKKFKREGWYTAGIDIQNLPENTLKFLDLHMPGDVSSTEDLKDFFKSAISEFGRLDAIINNAAIQICKPLANMSTAEWQKTIDVNLTAAFLTFKHGFPFLKKTHGAIVNVSSVHAVSTSKYIAAYAASKGGLLALTRAMALELAKSNVRVNAVLPGAVDTPMLRDGLQRLANKDATNDIDKRLLSLSEKHPLGRIGQPDEIAQMVYFLADSSFSGFITGQGFIVDGGATARLSTE